MPDSVRQRLQRFDPGQPVSRILFYRACKRIVELVFVIVYRIRVFGAANVPASGAMLVVSNHQSHLDPPIVGLALRTRHIVPLARTGLFKFGPFAWLIRMLNAIAIRQDESDTAAMRKAIAGLKDGRAVLVFPEGSRTERGDIEPFKSGAWVLLKRARCAVLPVAIEGAFDTWPRSRRFPRLLGRRLAVMVGEPIPYGRLSSMDAQAGLDEVARRIDAMRLDLRARLRRSTRGTYPAPGPGDAPGRVYHRP